MKVGNPVFIPLGGGLRAQCLSRLAAILKKAPQSGALILVKGLRAFAKVVADKGAHRIAALNLEMAAVLRVSLHGLPFRR